MTQHFRGPLEASVDAFGGLADGLDIIATQGQTRLCTTFDDFDGVVDSEGFGAAAVWETLGWVLTERGAAPVADAMNMNDPTITGDPQQSSISLTPGTDADKGGNAKLDRVASAGPTSGHCYFPHIWIPSTAFGAANLDNTDFFFACRMGLWTSATTWDGKAFVGFAITGDTDILDLASGAIAQPEGGSLVGFHVGEDGSIDGIAQRTAATAYVEGTNFTELQPATWNTGLTAGSFHWWDLALHIRFRDHSDAANNGHVRFAYRRLQPIANRPGDSQRFSQNWTRHPTVLTNQTPLDAAVLVPTLEIANGPVNDSSLYLDWWAFGKTRQSYA